MQNLKKFLQIFVSQYADKLRNPYVQIPPPGSKTDTHTLNQLGVSENSSPS